MTFKVSYVYDNPHGSGPFKGKTITDVKYAKGDTIYAVMGRATVTSCREIK